MIALTTSRLTPDAPPLWSAHDSSHEARRQARSSRSAPHASATICRSPLIAGPCALESRAHALETAEALKEIAAKAGIGLVYKTSFDKANRTSARSARGLGLNEALPIFAEIREQDRPARAHRRA